MYFKLEKSDFYLLSHKTSSMKCNELIKLLKQNGWHVERQKGSHMIMRHDLKSGQLVVPNHGSKEIATGTANSILKMAGIRKE